MTPSAIGRSRGALIAILAAVFALLFLGLAAAQRAGPEDLLSGMAALDRAYIPALALSNQGNAAATARALASLDDAWREFRLRYERHFPGDPAWGAGLEEIEAAIRNAGRLMIAEDLPQVHETLETVRDVFVHLRGELNVHYYLDDLNHYHAIMEEILNAAGDPSAGTLTDGSIREIARLVPEAETLWRRALERPFPSVTYGFTPERAKELRQAMQATGSSIAAVAAALESGEKRELVRAAHALKPAYTRAFLMFGDFTPYR